jgi:outer membrane lipoprotein-sorting protein
MGSEFAFEDMTSFEIEKFSFNFVEEQTFEDRETWVVEQTPIDEYSGYTKQKVWIDKEYHYVVQVEFYDRKNDLLKTLNVSEYKRYNDKFWRAHRSEMYNQQTSKSTVLIINDIRFDTGLKESDFNSNKLRNVR